MLNQYVIICLFVLSALQAMESGDEINVIYRNPLSLLDICAKSITHKLIEDANQGKKSLWFNIQCLPEEVREIN